MTAPTIPTHSELRAKALAATPGPWRTRAPTNVVVLADEERELEGGRIIKLAPEIVRTVSGAVNSARAANAAFIAAANPATVLSLLDQIAAMQVRLDRWEPRVNVEVGSTVVGDARCNKTIAGTGKPYPRTCMVCGLGPCRADQIAYSLIGKALSIPSTDSGRD